MHVRRVRPLAMLCAGAMLLVTAACGSSSGGGASGSSGASKPLTRLRIMAPADPGGGWDSTSREAQKALEGSNTVRKVEVFNVPGAGGTIGLAQLANNATDDQLLMTMGLVMVGAVVTNKSKTTLADVTPIAKLTSEQEIIVVPADSPYQTLQDFVDAWKANTSKLPIAGGSAGGTDQILAGLMAQAVGADPKKVNYVAFSGGGEALASLLGGKVAAGISGVSEFKDQIDAGKLRGLAVSGEQKVAGLDVPTLKEGNVDVSLTNWRGMVAPKGISKSQQAALVKVVEDMHGSAEWKAALKKNGWTDDFLIGQDFADYLRAEETRATTVLQQIGLA
ncbi:MAG: putative tricarboxylic transport rane protein [Actinomycetota bacterium]|nr:putative tricarboxylic transport rane protein [Actinomycetota bacterium]MDQ1664508.1 putative tricarboxylic transport rane protein [Actinomycetota bacterium]